jgi:DNA-binding transcriptional LysR family regulator
MVRRFALLQTFVAVARAGKMKQAAHELALTPGAVSQRIRQLEEAAGHRLFMRTGTGVELTRAGETMFAALAEPFRAIEAVDGELGRPPSRRVTVSTTPSFAATWLVPRLAKFAGRYPDIEIAVETGVRPVDLKREPVDLAIRHGLGKYPGLEATWLVAPELIVVASPEFLKGCAPLKRPADCLAFPAPRLRSPGLAVLVRSPWCRRAELQERPGVFGKSPDCPGCRRRTRTCAHPGYLCRRRSSVEETCKGAHRELAGAIRLLRRRDVRGSTKARRSAVSGLAGRGGETGNVSGIAGVT